MPGLFLLPSNCTKDARPLHRKRAGFIVFFGMKGGGLMSDCISRLVRCGVPESTAREVVRDFVARHQIAALYSYIHEVEVACGVA